MPKVSRVGNPLRSERIKVSTKPENYLKLKKLSVSCDMTISEMADTMLTVCLNNVDLIQYLQDRFNKHAEYRINPVKDGNKILF